MPQHGSAVLSIQLSLVGLVFRHIKPVSLTIVGGTENKVSQMHLCWSPPYPQDCLCNPHHGNSSFDQDLTSHGVRPAAETHLREDPKDGGNRTKGMSDLHLGSLKFYILWNVSSVVLQQSCIGDALKIKRFHGEQKDWQIGHLCFPVPIIAMHSIETFARSCVVGFLIGGHVKFIWIK